jgi:hypothetical protein
MNIIDHMVMLIQNSWIRFLTTLASLRRMNEQGETPYCSSQHLR